MVGKHIDVCRIIADTVCLGKTRREVIVRYVEVNVGYLLEREVTPVLIHMDNAVFLEIVCFYYEREQSLGILLIGVVKEIVLAYVAVLAYILVLIVAVI